MASLPPELSTREKEDLVGAKPWSLPALALGLVPEPGKVEEELGTVPYGGSPVDLGVPVLPVSVARGASVPGLHAAGDSPGVDSGSEFSDASTSYSDAESDGGSGARFQVLIDYLRAHRIPHSNIRDARHAEAVAGLLAYVMQGAASDGASTALHYLEFLAKGVKEHKEDSASHACPCCYSASRDMHKSFGSVVLICKTCSKRFSKLVKDGITLETLSPGESRDRRLFANMDSSMVGARRRQLTVPHSRRPFLVPHMFENGLSLASGVKKAPVPRRRCAALLNQDRQAAPRVDRVVAYPRSNKRPRREYSGPTTKALRSGHEAPPRVFLAPHGAHGPPQLLELRDPTYASDGTPIPQLTCVTAGHFDVHVDTSTFHGRCTWGLGVHVVVGHSHHRSLAANGDEWGTAADLRRLELTGTNLASDSDLFGQESEAALLKLVSKFADAKSTALGPPVCRFSSVVIREGATVGFVVLTGRWHMLKRTDTILDLREFTRTFWVYGTPTD